MNGKARKYLDILMREYVKYKQMPVVGLEPTSSRGDGFQDRCVYQFHHTGISILDIKGCGIKGSEPVQG